LRDATAVIVEEAEVKLGVNLALRRSLGVPFGRGHGVLRDAYAKFVAHAKVELSPCMPAICRLAPRAHNLGRRRADAINIPLRNRR
jgi:hypothetical protein